MRLVERVLPRHLQIIYEINGRFLREASSARTSDAATLRKVSLIDENGDRRVRMGNLAFVGSHRSTACPALHTELMKQTVFADFARRVPGADQQQDQRHHAAPLAAPVPTGRCPT